MTGKDAATDTKPLPSIPTSIVSKRGDIVAWAAALLGISAFFLVLKSFSIQPFAGDEYIYLFQGKLIAEGNRPYADFAMAHPPLQALFSAVVFALFGAKFTVMRLLPILWCLAGGVGLAVTVRRELGSLASVVAAALYLTAHEPLRASSHFTGVNMTVALMIFTVLSYRSGWIRTSAVLAVAAVLTRLYAIPGLAALAAAGLLSDRKYALRWIAYSAAIGAAAFIAVGIWAGFGETVHNLFAYHIDKKPMSESSLSNMHNTVLFHNATPASLFALSLPVLAFVFVRALSRTSETLSLKARMRAAVQSSGVGLPLLCTLIAAVFLVVLLRMNRVWMYYYIPAFPFAAVGAGWMVSRLVSGTVRLVKVRGNLERAGFLKSDVAVAGTALLLFGVAFYRSPGLEARLSYFQKSERQSVVERTHHYSFAPSPLPDAINDWVRAWFWKDERIIGEPYNTFNYYLWHESRVFDIADEVAEIIQKETSPSAAIFGDSGTVPLFALLSERDIAGNEVDTNIQRYRSGNADPRELISKIDNYKTEMIILRRRFGVSGVKEVRNLVETKYRRLKEIRSSQGWVFQIYKRKNDLVRLKES